MSTFQCTCGEHLIVPATGFVVCWFCRNEFSLKLNVLLQFEDQPKRPIIKSESVPVCRNQNRRSDFLVDI